MDFKMTRVGVDLDRRFEIRNILDRIDLVRRVRHEGLFVEVAGVLVKPFGSQDVNQAPQGAPLQDAPFNVVYYERNDNCLFKK